MKSFNSKLIATTLIAASVLSAPLANAEQSTLPSFLSGTDARPLTAAEMGAVRGERVPAWAIKMAVKIVGSALGQTIAVKLQNLLQGSQTPTYRDYQSAFGTRAAIILSLMPPALRPQIVQ